MKPKILVVDDDPYTRSLFEGLLRNTAKLETAATAAQARIAFRSFDFNLLILDQRLPDGNGLDLFAEIRAERPHQLALLITGFAEVRDAVRAVREGLFDYLTKPFHELDELEAVIGKALEMDRAYREINALRQTLGARSDGPAIIGHSATMERLLQQVRQAAPLDTTVLIEGESGTGKEVIANLIHKLSRRATRPLLELNCGALSESLLEATLFGYEKGAFTGATKATAGYFEEAHEGTLLLDEITDMSPKLQVSLLRVLQERRFVRIGSTAPRASDFRLICATNKSLEAEVKSGRFRSDLFYRLHVVAMRVPPLRDRKEDIVPMALLFLDQFNRKFGKDVGPFAPDAIAALEAGAWPGNVRELQNLVERVVVMKDAGPISSTDFGRQPGDTISIADPPSLSFRDARERFEREYFASLLKQTSGNVSEAARVSGIARQNFYHHLEQLGLTPRDNTNGT